MFGRTVAAGLEEKGCTLLRAWRRAACFDPPFGRKYVQIVGQWGFDATLRVACPGADAAVWDVTATSLMDRRGNFSLDTFEVNHVEA